MVNPAAREPAIGMWFLTEGPVTLGGQEMRGTLVAVGAGNLATSSGASARVLLTQRSVTTKVAVSSLNPLQC